jgi:hypothetical protein
VKKEIIKQEKKEDEDLRGFFESVKETVVFFIFGCTVSI